MVPIGLQREPSEASLFCQSKELAFSMGQADAQQMEKVHPNHNNQ